jgi:hypothetical protein
MRCRGADPHLFASSSKEFRESADPHLFTSVSRRFILAQPSLDAFYELFLDISTSEQVGCCVFRYPMLNLHEPK